MEIHHYKLLELPIVAFLESKKQPKTSKMAIDPLRGGGGGVHPDYFVKLDFEIAVDQQTRARDRTFEGVPDSG